jgi:hypothetical protein
MGAGSGDGVTEAGVWLLSESWPVHPWPSDWDMNAPDGREFRATVGRAPAMMSPCDKACLEPRGGNVQHPPFGSDGTWACGGRSPSAAGRGARADECRTIAECCNNAETRETMLRMADGHERMAEHADHSDGDAAGPPGAD